MVPLCLLCTTSVSPHLISPSLLPPNTSPSFSLRTAWLLLLPALSQAGHIFFVPHRIHAETFLLDTTFKSFGA